MDAFYSKKQTMENNTMDISSVEKVLVVVENMFECTKLEDP